jgi:polar amino acid transport system substrate-binding protein
MIDTAAIAREIAPKGRLRVALNHGNIVLVQRRAADGEARGITVDLARELAGRLALDVEFVHFSRAGDVADKAGADVWDVCFLAVDPLRAEQIAFSAPYVVIEGCYLVPNGSAAAIAADVDRLALRIGVVQGSAYALHLARTAQGAQIVTFQQFTEAAEALAQGSVDGLAGVRQAMERYASSTPGHRLLEPPFMEIRQAMGVVAGRPHAAEFVRQFIDEMRATGLIAEAAGRHGIEGVTLP